MTMAEIPSALSGLAAIAARLPGRRPALFLDFDGTLSPIVARPDDARLPAATRQLLAALAEHCPVALISGRALADLRARVGLGQLAYAGNHGFEPALPGRSPQLHAEAEVGAASIRRVAPLLAAEVERWPQAIFEDKGPTLTLHYRRCSDEVAGALQQRVAQRIAEFPDLELRGGKQVLEVRPRSAWGKGKAVRWLLAELGLASREALPIFIGDDVTDEDAFRELAEDGLGVHVGTPGTPTAASFRLADTDQVQAFLERLLSALAGRTGPLTSAR